MVRLEAALQALGTPGFMDVLRDELVRQDAFPRLLQHGLTYGSVALLDGVKITILTLEEGMKGPHLRLAVHYSSITTGCTFSEEPNPLSTMSEYVELALEIDRCTAEARITLAPD